MIAAGILILAFLFGTQLVRHIPIALNQLEYWAVSSIVGVLSITWLVFLSSLLIGQRLGIPLTLAVLTLITLGARLPKVQAFVTHVKLRLLPQAVTIQPSQLRQLEPMSFRLRIHSWVHLSIWLSVLWPLLISRTFSPGTGGWYSGGNSWGDLALHATLINYFAAQDQLVFASPLLYGENLTYPFLFDYFSTILVHAGTNLQQSIVLPSVAVGIALITLIFSVVYRMLRSLWVAHAASTVFLLNSSLGSWYLIRDWMQSGQSLWQFLLTQPHNYVHYEQQLLYWPQFMTDFFLPQRGILVGISVFLIVLLFIQTLLSQAKASAVDYKSATIRNVLIWIAVITGAMPFFHVHTFFVLCGVIGWVIAVLLIQRRLQLHDLLQPALILGMMAAPQLWWQFMNTGVEQFISVQVGWYAQEKTLGGILIFWLRNLGLEAVLAVVGTVVLYRTKKSPELLRTIVTPLWILFVLTNIFLFQPNPWDNTKFMLYVHLIFVFVSVYVLQVFLQSLHRSGLQRAWKQLLQIIIITSALCVLTVGGCAALIRELQSNWLFASTHDITIAAFIKKNTDSSARFLTADTHNHPVPMLAGRPILMGYRGWLWTYGSDYRFAETAASAVFTGAPTAKTLLKQYDISYVYIGPLERQQYKVADEFFTQFPVLYADEVVKIIDVRSTVDN